MTETLTWDSPYAIAMALKREYPRIAIEDVSLNQIFAWTLELPAFDDDPALCNEGILAAIFQEWFEETLHD